MPDPSRPSVARALGAALLLWAGPLVFGGCDGGGSKQASLYQRLVGTWTVERLEVGAFNRTPLLQERYSTVRFVFQSADGDRTYRVSGRRSDSTWVLSDGRVDLRGGQLLRMHPGFTHPEGGLRPVTWTFRFDASRAIFRLPENQRNGSRAFMTTLLPGRNWSASQGVRVQLAPVNE